MTRTEAEICMRFGLLVRLIKPTEPYGDQSYTIKELDKLIPYMKRGESDHNFQYVAHLFTTDGVRAPGYTIELELIDVVPSSKKFVSEQVAVAEERYVKSIITKKLAAGENKTTLTKWLKNIIDDIKKKEKAGIENE